MKKYAIILFFIIISIILIVSLLYLEPLLFEVGFMDEYASSITLNRNFNRCNVETIVNYKDNNEIVTQSLLDDGYKRVSGGYRKKELVNNSCDNLYKDYGNSKVKFSINGEKNIVVEALSEYNDEKYTINKKNKNVTLVSNVDTKKLGIQYIVYKLDEGIYLKYLIRKVEVKDTTKPSIELKGKDAISIYVNDDYNEPGYSANDNYDGDITDKVTIDGSVDNHKAGKYELVYKIKDSSGNEFETKRNVTVKEKEVVISTPKTNKTDSNTNAKAPSVDSASNLTYINGILIVNKTYGLPSTYNPGINQTAYSALTRMQNDAKALGYDLRLVSGFRSYQTQVAVYNGYVSKYGVEVTDTFSARPGHSEHQTGLAFDIGKISDSFGDTPSGKWLAENGHLYGFIIRYPQGKQSITGYKYEPWHVRYLGTDIATKVKESGLTLEEYLGI